MGRLLLVVVVMEGFAVPLSTPQPTQSHLIPPIASPQQGLGPLLRRHPSIWLIPLIITLLLIAAGCVGVLLAARDATASAVKAAKGFADNAAISINTQMELTGAAPLLALAAFIQEAPDFKSLNQWFQPVARKLLIAVRCRC